MERNRSSLIKLLFCLYNHIEEKNMKQGYTDITIILDKSSSMNQVRDETIQGFNSFIEDQKTVKVEKQTFNLIQFSTGCNVVYKDVDLDNVKPLDRSTFIPDGWTALYDAIGKTINARGKKYAEMKEEDRPERVIFIIITDGEENKSEEYDFKKIKDMLQHQQDVYNWKFIFLGSELKSVEAAQTLGIRQDLTLHYKNTPNGNSRMYDSLSRGITMMKSIDLKSYCNVEMFSKDDQKMQDES